MNPVLEQQCFDRLSERGETFATAESCTGGLIAKRITDLSGASRVFRGGVVCYWSSVKSGVLGVPQTLLDKFGAVSEPVGRAMAGGTSCITGATYGVAVTGVAGPDSDERGNPVGTVYVSVCSPGGTVCRRFDFGAQSREAIRNASADAAFAMLLEAMA